MNNDELCRTSKAPGKARRNHILLIDFWLKSGNPGVKPRTTTFCACPRLVSILERGANGCRAGCGGTLLLLLLLLLLVGGSLLLLVYCTFLLTVAPPDQGAGAASTLSMTNGNKQGANRAEKTSQEGVLFVPYVCLHLSEFTDSVDANTEMVWQESRSTLKTWPRSPCSWSTSSTRGCLRAVPPPYYSPTLQEEQGWGKMPTPSGAPAPCLLPPVTPVLGHSLGTLPKAEQILDPYFQPKAFLYLCWFDSDNLCWRVARHSSLLRCWTFCVVVKAVEGITFRLQLASYYVDTWHTFTRQVWMDCTDRCILPIYQSEYSMKADVTGSPPYHVSLQSSKTCHWSSSPGSCLSYSSCCPGVHQYHWPCLRPPSVPILFCTSGIVKLTANQAGLVTLHRELDPLVNTWLHSAVQSAHCSTPGGLPGKQAGVQGQAQICLSG